MSTKTFPTFRDVVNGDTSATANTLSMRDGNGDTTDRIVNAALAVTVGGYITEAVATVTASQTVDTTATLWVVDATAANVNLTLPAASALAGRRLSFIKKDSSGHSVTTTAAGSDTINGLATKTTSTQYVGWTLQSDGANWFVVP